jgi:hypothetical protein
MGLGDLFQTLCQLAIVHYGMQATNYFIFLSFSLLPYFFFFMYFEKARLAHRQHKNVFKVVVEADKEIGVLMGVGTGKTRR